MYAGTDDSGTLVFTDDPAKAPKKSKIRRKVNRLNNTTVLENFTQSDRKLVSMIEKALNAYCTYDLPALKSVTTRKYWPTLKDALDREGSDKGATFLREFCFTEFRADAVKHFTERSKFDGATYPFADMKFVASRRPDKDGGDDEITCTASFIKEKNGWKYIDILCGAYRTYYP